MTDNINISEEFSKNITYDNDLVKEWTVNLYKEKRDLSREIEEVESAISNESLWLSGSKTDEEVMSHASNLSNLKEYLCRLKQIENNAKSIGLPMDEFYKLGVIVL